MPAAQHDTASPPRVVSHLKRLSLSNKRCDIPRRGYKVDRYGSHWVSLWVDGTERLLGTFATEQEAEKSVRERIDGKQKPIFKED